MSRLQADLRRATALFQRKTISAEEYDAARSAADVAVEKHRQAVEQQKLVRRGLSQSSRSRRPAGQRPRPRPNTTW